MMYSNNFVVSVLVDGKVVEERKDGVCVLPFGSEYVLRLRNKHSRRAVAHIYIDDEKMSGGGIVIGAYSYVDLERPTTNNKKFKFVSLQSRQARSEGKSNNDDFSKGVIRVDFQLERKRERPVVVKKYIPYTPVYPNYPMPWYSTSYGLDARGINLDDSVEREEKTSGGIKLPTDALNFCDIPRSSNSCRSSSPAPKIQDGCTVQGNESSQSFYSVHVDLEPDMTTIVVLLKGTYDKPAKVAFCEKCGTKRKNSKAKFCYNCGGHF